MLRARLYELELKKREEQAAAEQASGLRVRPAQELSHGQDF